MTSMPDPAPLPPACAVRRLNLEGAANRWGPLATVVVDFRAASFAPDLFREHAIECPAVIARSAGKRQAEFFFGRWAARQAVASLGVASAQIPIGRSREPVWPAGVTGSISHADDIAVACACHGRAADGVGIDLERIPPVKVLAEIAQLTSNAAEKSCLRALASAHPELPPGWPATVLFSVKESIFKALFATVGRDLDFKDVALTAVDMERREIHLVWTRTLGADWRQGRAVVACFERTGDDDLVLTHWGWKRDTGHL